MNNVLSYDKVQYVLARKKPQACPTSGVRFIPFTSKSDMGEFINMNWQVGGDTRNRFEGYSTPSRRQQESLPAEASEIEFRVQNGTVWFRTGDERVGIDREGNEFYRYKS